MFQAELGAMVRREQMRDLVRESERRAAKKRKGQNDKPDMLERLLIIAPMCLAAARLLVLYVLQV